MFVWHGNDFSSQGGFDKESTGVQEIHLINKYEYFKPFLFCVPVSSCVFMAGGVLVISSCSSFIFVQVANN